METKYDLQLFVTNGFNYSPMENTSDSNMYQNENNLKPFRGDFTHGQGGGKGS